jgi:hypothetical protein
MTTRPISGRETVPGFLRDLNVRLSRLERHSHGVGGATDNSGNPQPHPPTGGGPEAEVEIGPPSVVAANPKAELWYDPYGIPSGGGGDGGSSGPQWWPNNYNELAAGPP